MTTTSYWFAVLVAVVFCVIILELLRRRKLKEKHALWWIIGGIIALVVAIFPELLDFLSQLVGVKFASNFVFFIGLGILALLALQHSSEISKLEEKTRTLAEKCADLEYEISIRESSDE